MSCDGPGLAETFATRLKLKDCTISYIGSDNDMPAWGQLGCNGFIVLDSSHSVVCRATTAYQQVGPRAAFGHVETLLSALIDKKSSGGVPPALPGPTIPAGETVRLHGLKSRADLNGTYGVCVQGPEGDPEGRCVVRLTDGTPLRYLRIRMDNLIVDTACMQVFTTAPCPPHRYAPSHPNGQLDGDQRAGGQGARGRLRSGRLQRGGEGEGLWGRVGRGLLRRRQLT